MASKPVPPRAQRLVVAYLRVSTDEQINGLEAQRAAIERWAAQNGHEVAEWYEDRLSGTTALADRPGLIAALSAKPRMLVLAKRDRLARDIYVAAGIVKVCEQAGIDLVFADGVSFGDSPEGKLMATILYAFAEYERNMIALRTKVGLAAKKARGERLGCPPYGYTYSNKGLVPHDEEQAVIRRVLDMRASGMSYLRIVEALNAADTYRRPGAQRWHEIQVIRIITRWHDDSRYLADPEYIPPGDIPRPKSRSAMGRIGSESSQAPASGPTAGQGES